MLMGDQDEHGVSLAAIALTAVRQAPRFHVVRAQDLLIECRLFAFYLPTECLEPFTVRIRRVYAMRGRCISAHMGCGEG